MSRQSTNKRLVWGLEIFLLALVILLVSMKFITDAQVRGGEQKYPPATFTSVEGVRMHYQSQGSGQPVVFIGGRNSKIQDFTLSPLLEPLSARYQAIFIDRPGLGYSERPAHEPATIRVQVRLIHTALVQLGIEKPVLVGQSRGGAVVLQYALDYPNQVTGIVLIGSSPYPRLTNPDPLVSLVQTPMIGDILLHTLYVPLTRQLAPSFLKENANYFAPLKEVPPVYIDTTTCLSLRPSMIKTDAEEEKFFDQNEAEVVARLGEISAPVIVLTGSLDTYAVTDSARLAQDLMHATLKRVEGAHHFLWFAHPEAVIEAIQMAWAQANNQK